MNTRPVMVAAADVIRTFGHRGLLELVGSVLRLEDGQLANPAAPDAGLS